jgi:pilus assembly protein CpaB
VVAARALTPGETVDNTALRLISWPRGEVPPGAFNVFESVTGKVVKNSLSINQPIVATALLEPEKTGGVLPLLIPPGMRALSIAVDDISDMAGFVLPHSRVDVLVSVALGGPAAGPAASGEVTKIVLQNITVLAVAQTLEAGPDQPREVKVVTLLVTPPQAERLAAASRLGTLTLAMRNFADDKELATSGVSVPALLGLSPLELRPPAQEEQQPVLLRDHVQAPRRQRYKAIEVIRNGIDHQTSYFSANGRIRAAAAPAAPPAAAAGPSEAGPPIQ